MHGPDFIEEQSRRIREEKGLPPTVPVLKAGGAGDRPSWAVLGLLLFGALAATAVRWLVDYLLPP